MHLLPGLRHRFRLNLWPYRPLSLGFSLCLSISGSLALLSLPVHARQKGALTDEDILNPNKLIFDRVVPFVDSFDGARVGTVFVTKRAILAHPTKGIFGEKCAGICPPGTDEIDASYVYVFQKKGECVIGVRGIGWGEKVEKRSNNGDQVEVGRVRHQSNATNIASITINGVRVGPPANKSQLGPPNGTNYKYYPRRQNSFGKSMGTVFGNAVSTFFSSLLGEKRQGASQGNIIETYSSTNEGYITDIHYFPAQELVKVARQGYELVIDMPAWLPSRHVISGNSLAELRQLAATCEID